MPQAYLSRKLRDDLGLHVLALDWSDIQSKGAARKESHNHKASQKPRRTSADPPSNQFPVEKTKAAAQITRPKGSLVYKTVQVTQSSLVDATNDWVRDNSSHAEPTGEQVVSFPETPVPILFVALHACGSLTPNVLRTLISRLKSAETAHTADTARSWTPRAAVIVGCCYNLLDPTDFPLSCALSHSPSNIGAVALTPNHMQLAAQVPCQWLRTEESLGAAGLAIRKVAWRALLEDRLAQHEGEDSTDSTTIPTAGQSPPEEPRRLGRLNDSAYRDWDPFLARAGLKFGVDLTKGGRRKDRAMESRIEVFQVLRCLLGPVVESLIILDRQQWLAEQLEGTMMESQLVNLFDQASGSGRNVAIAIAPGLSQTPIH
ncbi:hypothetical protein B0H21DRAFT_760249 [Amylocystis lapponica]|nr:hypothetical protein B0H21DRAFT_760249 [Amylocystis lapponica]